MVQIPTHIFASTATARGSLRRALAGSEFVVVGEGLSPAHYIPRGRAAGAPVCMVWDIGNLQGSPGPAMARAREVLGAPSWLIVVTDQPTPELGSAVYAAGGDGIVARGLPAVQLLTALRRILAGEPGFPPALRGSRLGKAA